MKRTPLKRGGPLKRKAGLRNRKPMKRVNEERAAIRAEEAASPDRVICRASPCCVCGRTPADPHHLRSRGAGGKDRGNVVPLCRRHHDQAHAMGCKSFQAGLVHRVDFAKVAREIEAKAYGW